MKISRKITTKGTKKLAILMATTVLLGLTGCGSTNTNSSTSQGDSTETTAETTNSEDGVRTVKVALMENYPPNMYVDENGNPTGYEVEVMRRVDELIPEYQFEFVPTAYDDERVGVEQGKYQVGLWEAYYTSERAEKYLFPKNYDGGSINGVAVKAENADIKSLEDIATKGLKVAPVIPGDGLAWVLEDYNANHPDNQIKITYRDDNNMNSLLDVSEGGYDVSLINGGYWSSTVLDENSDFHYLKDELTYVPFLSIKTYPVINKKEQDLADKIDKALGQLIEDGTLKELSTEYFKEDVFRYMDGK